MNSDTCVGLPPYATKVGLSGAITSHIAHPDWRRGVRPALGKLAPPRRMGFARRAVFRSVGRKPYDLNSASSIRLRSSPESARWGTFAVRSTERYFAL